MDLLGEGRSPNSDMTLTFTSIVLMDELDQLVTTKQDVVYNFFNWPNLVGSRLIVLAVANTHDLPERALNAKVRSRLGSFLTCFHNLRSCIEYRNGPYQFCALYKGATCRNRQFSSVTRKARRIEHTDRHEARCGALRRDSCRRCEW